MKTQWVDANPGQGILGTLVTAAWLRLTGNHRHTGIDEDGHCPLDYYVAGGTPNALTVTCNPPLTAHIPGMPIYVKAIGDNLGSDVTVKVDGLDTVVLKAAARRDLATGNIRKDKIFGMAWDGTCYQVITALSEPAGSIFMHPTATPPPGALVRDGSVLSRTAYAALFYELVTRSGFTPQAFTCTIANPAVFTKSNHGFAGGERLRLSTTGALPTGLSTSVDYFVEVIDANSFYLHAAARRTDARLSTSGAQSGTHSFLRSLYGLGDGSTTFALPDDRDLFERGVDLGRGGNPYQCFGAEAEHAIQSHDHYIPTPTGPAGSRAAAQDDTGYATSANWVLSSGDYYTYNIGPSGNYATETRPVNRAYLPCIFY